MYILEMIDSWDRTIKSWCVKCSEDVIKGFVKKYNNFEYEYYFSYHKLEVSGLPTEEELHELVESTEFELEMRESTFQVGENLLKWDTSKDTNPSNMFKNCGF
jgi:hypothetical protein